MTSQQVKENALASSSPLSQSSSPEDDGSTLSLELQARKDSETKYTCKKHSQCYIPELMPSVHHDVSTTSSFHVPHGYKLIPTGMGDPPLQHKCSHMAIGIESNSPPHHCLSLHACSYPDIKGWLSCLDEDTLCSNQAGPSKVNFSEFGDVFINNGINYINQLVNWDYKMLIDKPFEMLIGQVKDLLGWAQLDVAAFEASYDI